MTAIDSKIQVVLIDDDPPRGSGQPTAWLVDAAIHTAQNLHPDEGERHRRVGREVQHGRLRAARDQM